MSTRYQKKPEPQFGDTITANGSKSMWRAIKLHNGMILCGRCLEPNKPSKQNKAMCHDCWKRAMRHAQYDRDQNKFNVKDAYCFSTIRHHEKTFKIDILVDEKTQRYLTAVGYGFIFKDPYDESQPIRKINRGRPKKD